MKKTMVLCISLCTALAFTSCKSSESAYKKAYDKAKAQEATQQNEPMTTSPVVTPLEQKSATETTVMDRCCSRFFLIESQCRRCSEYVEKCRI